MSGSFSKIFGRHPLALFFVGTLFTSVLVGIASVPSASAITIPKTITTCTNIKTGINRLLVKGACKTSIEKKVTWKYTGAKLVKGGITTCIDLKTSASRILLKGVCNIKIEKKTTWVKVTGTSTIPTPASFKFKVGETGPGGGLIFFVDTKNAYPNFVYLEAAPTDLNATYAWCSDSSHAISGLSEPTGTPVGRGSINSTAMLAACTSGAANAAHAFTNNGMSDWFLPSRDELMLMYTNIHSLSTFAATDYWSSSQNSETFAMTVNFGSGNWFSIDKSFARHVRPMRAFSAAETPAPQATSPSAFAYKIGDIGPGGGLIFFVDTKNEYANFDFLEAAPVDLPAKYAWCSDTSHAIAAVSGKDAWAVGRGQANTTAMLTACTSGAANAAHAYSNNSKTDWFLPSINELKLMYDNVRGSQGYVANGFPAGYRWSSTGDVDSVAMVQGFFDGSMTSTGGNMKSEPLFVRPIRAF